MTASDIVEELKPSGTEQTRNILLRNGAREPVLGVKVEEMKKIQKRVRMDYRLALELYDTGIADMQYLAGLIADDATMTMLHLRKWIETANGDMVARYTVPWVASGSPCGRDAAIEWIASSDEVTSAAGWPTYGSMASTRADADLDLAEIAQLLQRVESSIEQQASRVRVAMNSFVISIACYVEPLHELAVETASALGRVAAERSGSCTTPCALDQIQKFEARSPIGRKRKTAKC